MRYTRDEDIHSIHFPQFPERIKDITLEGLAAPVVKTAQQVIHSFTIETIAVLFALADITSLNGRNFRGISLADLKQIWGEKEDPNRFYWTDVSRLTSPVSLDTPPAEIIDAGFAQLRQQGLIKGEDNNLKISPKLRAVVRSLDQPKAFSSIYISHLIDDNNIESEGFAVFRTEYQLWLWELKENIEVGDPNAKIEVNLFQITGQQLSGIIDHFLGTDETDSVTDTTVKETSYAF